MKKIKLALVLVPVLFGGMFFLLLIMAAAGGSGVPAEPIEIDESLEQYIRVCTQLDIPWELVFLTDAVQEILEDSGLKGLLQAIKGKNPLDTAAEFLLLDVDEKKYQVTGQKEDPETGEMKDVWEWRLARTDTYAGKNGILSFLRQVTDFEGMNAEQLLAALDTELQTRNDESDSYTSYEMRLRVDEQFLEVLKSRIGLDDKTADAVYTLWENGYVEIILTPEATERISQILEETTEDGTIIEDFLWPVPGYTDISSPFGWRIHPVYKDRRYHTGVDIPAPAGTSIIAVADGTVIIAHTTDDNAYGIHVKIKHESGFESFYAHCTSILVTSGQTVEAGEVIALVGTTGVSTGNHLHFEVWKNGERVNPMGGTPTETPTGE